MVKGVTEMTVLLNDEVKKGWNVTFRNGGQSEITHIRRVQEKGSTKFLVEFDDCRSSIEYNPYGRYRGGVNNNPFDISCAEPPKFDWSTVKRGMAFIDPFDNVRYYVGKSVRSKGIYLFEDKNVGGVKYFAPNSMTRAEQYDRKV